MQKNYKDYTLENMVRDLDPFVDIPFDVNSAAFSEDIKSLRADLINLVTEGNQIKIVRFRNLIKEKLTALPHYYIKTTPGKLAHIFVGLEGYTEDAYLGFVKTYQLNSLGLKCVEPVNGLDEEEEIIVY